MMRSMTLGRPSGRHAGSGHPLVLETRGTEHDAAVTHIDRLSRGLTYGLQVIEGLHRAGVESRSLAEDFDTANGKLQLSMVLAFSEWWRNSIRNRSVAGQAKARAEGRFPSIPCVVQVGHYHSAPMAQILCAVNITSSSGHVVDCDHT